MYRNNRQIRFYGRIIVVTNGFIKKTQKTPEKEIILAERRRSEYEAEDNKEHT